MSIETRSARSARQRGSVIGIPIDAVSWPEAQQRLMAWAVARESRYVCICNVHSVVTATQDATFRQVVEQADMATPDGAPVAWTLQRKGFPAQPRINGPDLMWRLCANAQDEGVRIGLFGSSPQTLALLTAVLTAAFPALQIGYCVSPPFRSLSEAEDMAICRDIKASGVGLLFVGLGCPKQEAWIAAHRGRVGAVMLGVGAAFDYHAGTISRAPDWMRSAGLEWLHRLGSEPRRLWRRYFATNSIFLFATARDALGGGFRSPRARTADETQHD
jgi:N-acetylglucosaminyldiphosphoundecaprenol N-acetyl-beta-D-mannosaminyltransferase